MAMSIKSLENEVTSEVNEHGHDVTKVLHYDENGNPVYSDTKYGLFGDQIKDNPTDSEQSRWKPQRTSYSK